MIETEFKRADGSKGFNYKPENGDEIICQASTIFVSQPRAVIVDKGKPTERAINIISRGISAKWNDKDIFCNLTEGQTKNLSKTPDLMGKKVVFENYENEKYGTLVGASVKKD